jgi:hypothetical protein
MRALVPGRRTTNGRRGPRTSSRRVAVDEAQSRKQPRGVIGRVEGPIGVASDDAVAEEPVAFARERAGVPDADLRARKERDEAALEVSLGVEGDVDRRRARFAHELSDFGDDGERPPYESSGAEAAEREGEDAVDFFHRAHGVGEALVDEPEDLGLGEGPFQCGRER